MKYLYCTLIIVLFASSYSYSQEIRAKRKKTKWGFVKGSRLIVDYKFDSVEEIEEGCFRVSLDDKLGLVGPRGKELVACDYDDISYSWTKAFNLTKGKYKGIYVINHEILLPAEYDEINYIPDELFLIKKSGKWGGLDLDTKLKIPLEYESIFYDVHNVLFADKNGKVGAFDISGEELLPFEFERIDNFSRDGSLVKKEGSWGIYKNGKFQQDGERLVFTSPEQMPIYEKCAVPGTPVQEKECSSSALLISLYGNIRYPAQARENGIQGTAIVEFLVSPEGKLSEFKNIRTMGGGCDEEALRVMKLLHDFTPGYQDGKAVWTKFVFPVKFKLR